MSLFIFAIILSVLIAIHEWGHYYMAIRLGVHVERFSIGFGPVLYRWMVGKTEFCISAIPLGGYVKPAGDDPKKCTGAPEEFMSHPVHHRALIVIAGPMMNAVLAFLIFSAIHMAGMPYAAATNIVGEVVADSPAEAAGFKVGDRIVGINSEAVATCTET